MLNALDRREYAPCASLLKPLYAWVTPEAHPRDVEAAIRSSDNAATDRIVAAAGGLARVLGRLVARTGVAFEPAATWGQVLVLAERVETTYGHLFESAASSQRPARTVVEHMRHVYDEQRFGAPTDVPVKAGWDVEQATGAVLVHVVVQDGDGQAQVALTRTPVEPGSLPVPFAGEPALALARSLQGDLAARLLARHTR